MSKTPIIDQVLSSPNPLVRLGCLSKFDQTAFFREVRSVVGHETVESVVYHLVDEALTHYRVFPYVDRPWRVRQFVDDYAERIRAAVLAEPVK